jgi:hypothetical protein
MLLRVRVRVHVRVRVRVRVCDTGQSNDQEETSSFMYACNAFFGTIVQQITGGSLTMKFTGTVPNLLTQKSFNHLMNQ